jgi:hypothetical protein
VARCLVRWADPAGISATRMCGRLIKHPGNHAAQGADGSWALWTPAGDLVMAVEQRVIMTEPSAPEIEES